MSTYVRALSPAKTVSGSEDSWFSARLSQLWGGGRKQSGLHSAKTVSGSEDSWFSARLR
jgi:hypothetical protein